MLYNLLDFCTVINIIKIIITFDGSSNIIFSNNDARFEGGTMFCKFSSNIIIHLMEAQMLDL